MATLKWVGQLRRWEDAVSISLGIVAAVAPWFLPTVQDAWPVILNALVVGLVIAGLATLDLLLPSHWEEPFEMIAGVWLMLAPVWLGYGETLGTVHTVIGAAVVVLRVEGDGQVGSSGELDAVRAVALRHRPLGGGLVPHLSL